jgi:cytochrome b561
MIDRLIVTALEWAAGHHDEGRYSPVAILFHWVMAVLVTFQLAWGWWMGQLPAGGDKVLAHDLHYGVGVLMLLLTLGRSAWRLLAPGPINDADKPGWESTAATILQWLFYLCLFGLPISGWAMISATAREQDLSAIGLIPWPLMPLQDLSAVQAWKMEAVAGWLHDGLIITLLLLIPVHVGAALKHQIIDRDDVLHGILPVVPKPTPRRTRWQRRYRAVEKRIGALAKRLWRPSRRRSA